MTDTIFAPATAAGRSAVAVVRLSGPQTGRALTALAGKLPKPREAALRILKDAEGRAIDQALVLWFEGPSSYTGEDAAEFHVHGGPAVVAGLLEAIAAQGLRLAEPGEFTRRAFENGKLDLAQAEGVADLIEAETEAQRRQALDQLGGALGQAQTRWRDGLIEALAMFEAAVDFADEEIPADVAARARPVLQALIAELELAVADVKRGERVREGFRIALIGAPNAGKSTILNALARREAAIVTATPGTTRDVIEVPMRLAGYKALLADTAGLRDTHDEIEAEGVRRARAWAGEADLRIWVVDGASDAAATSADLHPHDLCVINKADLGQGAETGHALVEARALNVEVLRLSAWKPDDISALEKALERRIVEALAGAELPTATRLRHRELLSEALERLNRALLLEDDLELAAEDVRLAGRALDRITGRIDPEDVLDRVFSSFCIGK
ncbi:tRNA modification GTPase MnmE [Phenylobacterium sp. Root77]|jgi:tRNA modification GTPase|uniref:tRNA uridine-5-carboxymethylaminomethyl(34) synthesis GTPase MnmE n=1 Tax=unclassified Phenylobacterium TaxID=2640670 RepID=UPI0006F36711|nr:MULTISPECIES: tRNA uridine-5-carboxymethylaminomethyl(34) synthesis GTPase MnmE [unclassified Phenylobacterium]KQW69129.1 tRNA modification GTPase MnmE [Phenylobacterium sp. Root1277]KQW95505.1 tRNA modification GTPase MnmE [Phenylobacterium sp. Root1290]KRC41295.1 tRNA modification GTPase MnmE [Phenylobacterium sp. Root77]